MKGKLIALSLIAASGLMADYETQQNRNTNKHRETEQQPMYQDNCDPCAPVCEPCCVPQPRKCINMEAYNPSYYMLQCDWGAFVLVDFIYWFARENNLPFALDIQNGQLVSGSNTNLVFLPVGEREMNTKWAPGFRVGLGWNSCYDGWDASAVYTWYRGSKKTTATANGPFGTTTPDFPLVGGFGLINPFVNAAISAAASTDSVTTIYDTITGKWKFRFQQVDAVVGRKYWTSRHFTVHPFAGVRGSWTRTKFSTQSGFANGSGLTALSRSFSDKFTDRYWGVGIVAGMDSNFYFGCDNEFSFYGSADLALIYGKYKSTKKESYVQTVGSATLAPNINTGTTFHNSFFQMVPMIDLGLGFSWEDYWCCDRYRTELDIGWEHHVMLSHTHRIVTEDPQFEITGITTGTTQSSFTTYDVLDNDTMFGGLVVRLKFDF